MFCLIDDKNWQLSEKVLYCYLCFLEDASVPSCIRIKEFLQLIDAGVMINMPYPPFLGEKRDTDLLIALEYGADETFRVRCEHMWYVT